MLTDEGQRADRTRYRTRDGLGPVEYSGGVRGGGERACQPDGFAIVVRSGSGYARPTTFEYFVDTLAIPEAPSRLTSADVS